MTISIRSMEVAGYKVSGITSWIFLRLTGDDGLTGFGEATLQKRDGRVIEVARQHAERVLGEAGLDPDLLFERLPFSNLPEAAFSSALMQAAYDLRARSAGKSVAETIGRTRSDRVSIYANINRRTRDRSPDGFRTSAGLAVQRGFTAFKIAPFDGLATDMGDADAAPFIDAGFARIEAVRAAIGPDARLMVDCHWRFNEATAAGIVGRLEESGIYWFECPLPEKAENLTALSRLRAQVNARGIRLAGCETEIRRQGFLPFLEAGAYDVMMPDVQYAGGPLEMLRIAELFGRFGVEFSPHNPTGPIAHAHALQVCGALSGIAMLETQFDETPLFDALVAGGLPDTTGGVVTIPNDPGIGVSLDEDVCRSLEVTDRWSSAD